MTKKAVLYLRVSSQSQVDNFSLQNQEIICKEYAGKNNYEVIKVFIEPGESAKTDDRPEFQKMLLFCRQKENEINEVVFYHSSRFSRNTSDFLNIAADLARYGIGLDSVTEPLIKEMSPEARLYTTIVSSFNQYENENRARSTANGMKRRFLEGYPTSFVPIGYLLSKKAGEKSQAIRDEVWFPIIKNMWERIANERLTLANAVFELNKYKLKKFSKTTLHEIFSNHFYYGLLQSKKYGTAQGRHEPMITEELYYQVQAVFAGRNPSTAPKTHFRDDFMLRGILVCPLCGHKLSSCYTKGKKETFAYYLCSSRGLHGSTSFPRDFVENKFLELLKSLEPAQDFIDLKIALMLEKFESQNKVMTETKEKIAEDIKRLTEMKATLKEKHLTGIYSDKDFMESRDDLETRIMAKKTLYSDKSVEIDEVILLMVWIKAFFTHLEKIFITAPPEARQALGCSIFPEGLNFIDKDFRTPKIARCYQLKEAFADTLSDRVTPLCGTSNTIIEEWFYLYRQFSPLFASQIATY